ncbi:MAG: putative peroxiredoxin bcp [Fimbriimonadaceae bacterium]|nr:putative peroxiredoxin bcp [Fimbriimonadaceae bacterium]
MVEEGEAFPNFSLRDDGGNVVDNSVLAGRKAVLFFYPKDDTSGCTIEACQFRDALPQMSGVAVYGISPDSAKSHQKFIKKHALNFPLLVDENHGLADKLGIWVEKQLYGKKYMGVERTTFLIDQAGNILKIWRRVKPEGHSAEVTAALG